jgi:hypothetical protein
MIMLVLPDSKVSSIDSEGYTSNDTESDIQLFSLFTWFYFNIDRTLAFIHARILVLGSGGIFFKRTDLFPSNISEKLHGLHINISADEMKRIIFYHGNSADEGNQTN